MAPLILDIKEDEEDTDHHGDDDADNHEQATVHPAAVPQGVRFSFEHFVFSFTLPAVITVYGVCPPSGTH